MVSFPIYIIAFHVGVLRQGFTLQSKSGTFSQVHVGVSEGTLGLFNFSFPVGMEGADCSAWIHVRGARNRWLRERTWNTVPRTQWVPPYGLLWGLWQWAKAGCQGTMPHFFIPSSHMLVYNSFHFNYTGLSCLLIHF